MKETFTMKWCFLYEHCYIALELQTLLYLQDFTNIAVLLWNYIVTLCLLVNIYIMYLHEHKHGLMNVIFHEIMTVAARLECYNKLS